MKSTLICLLWFILLASGGWAEEKSDTDFRLEGDDLPKYTVVTHFLAAMARAEEAEDDDLARLLKSLGLAPQNPEVLKIVSETNEVSRPVLSERPWDPDLVDDPEAFMAAQKVKSEEIARSIGKIYALFLLRIEDLGASDVQVLDDLIDHRTRPSLAMFGSEPFDPETYGPEVAFREETDPVLRPQEDQP